LLSSGQCRASTIEAIEATRLPRGPRAIPDEHLPVAERYHDDEAAQCPRAVISAPV
jgi:hypothetical protein